MNPEAKREKSKAPRSRLVVAYTKAEDGALIFQVRYEKREKPWIESWIRRRIPDARVLDHVMDVYIAIDSFKTRAALKEIFPNGKQVVGMMESY